MDDFEFQERVRREAEARECARRLLGVAEGASTRELKRAWREACKKHHPDSNAGAPGADRKFVAVDCAYRLLAHGEPCEMLLELSESTSAAPADDKYNLENKWGFFLWWRDRFF